MWLLCSGETVQTRWSTPRVNNAGGRAHVIVVVSLCRCAVVPLCLCAVVLLNLYQSLLPMSMRLNLAGQALGKLPQQAWPRWHRWQQTINRMPRARPITLMSLPWNTPTGTAGARCRFSLIRVEYPSHEPIGMLKTAEMLASRSGFCRLLRGGRSELPRRVTLQRCCA